MMKKNKLIFAIILIFTAAQIYAQNVGSLSLETVCAGLASKPNSTGDFKQIKTIQTNGRKLTSTGTYIISTYGICWKTEKPFPSSLILTENAMVQISANGTKSVMSGKDNQIFSNISATLSSVFSGNSDALKKNFDCDFSDDGKGSWKIALKPKDSTIASVMNKLELTGTYDSASKSAVLNSLEMAETSDNTISYIFTNQKYPEDLSADEKQIFIVD